MGFSDLFDSGFRQRNRDHFAAIVRVAMGDGYISEGEKAFLDRLSKNLDISDQDYEGILQDYYRHPINPPVFYDHRLERLYDLARMVYVDHIKGDDEEKIIRKIGIGLGFTPENVPYIVDKALTLVGNGVDLETFIMEIKTMNR